MTEADHVTYGSDPLQTDIAIQSLNEMDSLSYEEYFNKIDEIRDLLKTHWIKDQRVKSLKVAIQLAKLLSETSQLKLYARKYKVITEILDEFGKLIYLRVHSIASGNTGYDQKANTNRQSTLSTAAPNFSDNPTAASRELAKDICRNWFLKIASIRELAPRFYCELAILKVCDILLTSRFASSIETTFYAQTLTRLTKSAWGFGDPIVALHARLYLCKVAERLIGWDNGSKEKILFDLVTSNVKNSMVIICNLNMTSLITLVRIQHADLILYYDLVLNAVQSMLSILQNNYEVNRDDKMLVGRSKSSLEKIIENTLLDSIDGQNILAKCVVIDAISKALPEDVMTQHTSRLLNIVKDVHTEFQSRYVTGEDLRLIVPILYSILNNFMVALDSSETFEQDVDIVLSKHIMESVHIMLSELLNAECGNSSNLSPQYIKSFQSLISYTSHYIGQKDVDKLVGEFINRIQLEGRCAHHCQIISSIIKTLFSNKSRLSEYSHLIASHQCTKLIYLLHKDNYKLEVSQWILENMRSTVIMSNKKVDTSIIDRSTINFIMKLCAAINDSLSFLTTDHDCEHLSQLVIFFLKSISISDHKERLDFFSRFRGSSGNLDLVIEYLARQVLDLLAESQNTDRRSSQRKNFLNGCLAYVLVSIPAIKDEMVRVAIAIDGCHLALKHTSLSIADYYAGQIIAYLNEQVQKELELSTAKIQTNYIDSGEKKPQFSKQLLDRIETFLILTQEFQEHVDLKHKLALSDLIRKFLNDQSHLMRNLGPLCCFDDVNDTDVNVL